MNIAVSDRIEANDRIDISYNKTTLTISNTKDSDAGKYQVRIDLLTFGSHSSPECDQSLLEVLGSDRSCDIYI